MEEFQMETKKKKKENPAVFIVVIMIVCACVVFIRTYNTQSNVQEEFKYDLSTETEKSYLYSYALTVENESVGGQKQEIINAIKKYSNKYKVDPALIYAVIGAESDFNPKAKSHAGAMGLMQLMPQTAKILNVKNAYDIDENVMGGTSHLKSMLDMFDNNLPLALAGYNAGHNRVIKAGYKIPNIKETQNYVPKVIKKYKEMKGKL